MLIVKLDRCVALGYQLIAQVQVLVDNYQICVALGYQLFFLIAQHNLLGIPFLQSACRSNLLSQVT